MLTEILLIAGAAFVGKKALDNPEKTEEIVNRFGSALAKAADRAAYDSSKNLSYDDRQRLHSDAQRLASQTGTELKRRNNYDFDDD